MTLREFAAAIDAELVGEAGEAEVLGLTSLDAMAPAMSSTSPSHAAWPRWRPGRPSP